MGKFLTIGTIVQVLLVSTGNIHSGVIVGSSYIKKLKRRQYIIVSRNLYGYPYNSEFGPDSTFAQENILVIRALMMTNKEHELLDLDYDKPEKKVSLVSGISHYICFENLNDLEGWLAFEYGFFIPDKRLMNAIEGKLV